MLYFADPGQAGQAWESVLDGRELFADLGADHDAGRIDRLAVTTIILAAPKPR
jgi:hypothetical protein